MQIKKAAEAINSGAPTAVQLEAINAQAKAQLSGEQVYVFSLRLCDDQVDRFTPRHWVLWRNCSSEKPVWWTTNGVRTSRLPGFLRPRW